MDVKYINPFLNSTVHTFASMIQLQVSPQAPFSKDKPYPSYDVSGIIGLTGQARGYITLSFPKQVAIKVAGKLLAADIKTVDADVTDAVGELTNIIAGNAKKDLHGLDVSISLPRIIVGKEHNINGPGHAQHVVVPFKSDLGLFNLEVSLALQ